MTDPLLDEINDFIASPDEASSEQLNAKELVDNFIACNDATVQEINQFIEALHEFEDEEEDESSREEEKTEPKKQSEKLGEIWEETQNEIVCLLEEPSSFIGNTIRQRSLGNGISIVIGMLKDNITPRLAIQGFRFKKDNPYNWTMDKARAWVEGKKVIGNQKLSKKLHYVKLKDVKIKQVLQEGTQLRITGIAISEGTWNGIFYPAEELEKAVKTLQGKPLRIDHSSSSRDIVGKVIKAVYLPEKKWIEFEAIVTDKDIAQKLLDGLIDSVSVGVLLDKEEEDGKDVARNLEFKELSLVDDPACKDAKTKPVAEAPA